MKRMLFSMLIVPLYLSSPAILMADDIESLRKDLEELKVNFEVLEAEAQNSEQINANRIKVSGYADIEYIMNDKGGTTDGFRTHHLSLFFKKQVSDKWRFFSEIEYEDAPKVGESKTVTITHDGGTPESFDVSKNQDGKIFVEVFTLEYLHSPYLNFRAGRFLTPGGIWNVEHYPPFVATQERPQHIRKIFPQLNDGLQFFGTVTAADVVTDYILYTGNGSGNSGHGDTNDNKSLGGRLKFKLPLLLKTEVGLSGYSEKDNSGTDLTAYGADINLQWSHFRLQGEYATGSYDKTTGTDYDRKGYYGQLTYSRPDYDLIYRYDWYEADDTVAQGGKTINSLALNYHFTPSVVGKVEHHMNDEEDPAKEDYDKTILSIAVYLGE